MVVLDLIKSSLRLIGAIATGETPDAEESADCLLMLNQLLETLGIEGTVVWDVAPLSFPLIINQSSYTIGPAANFNTARPIEIRDAYVTDNGITYPVTKINQQQYDTLGFKAQTSTLPIYFNHISGQINGSIVLWPVPSKITTLTLNIDSQFVPFVLTSDTVLWPLGYARMIKYLLALEIANDFDKQISPQLYQTAMEAKASIKRLNTKSNTPLSYDSTLTGRGTSNQLLTGISGGY